MWPVYQYINSDKVFSFWYFLLTMVCFKAIQRVHRKQYHSMSAVLCHFNWIVQHSFHMSTWIENIYKFLIDPFFWNFFNIFFYIRRFSLWILKFRIKVVLLCLFKGNRYSWIWVSSICFRMENVKMKFLTEIVSYVLSSASTKNNNGFFIWYHEQSAYAIMKFRTGNSIILFHFYAFIS